VAKGFDFQTHSYDKTGKINRANPYTMRIEGGTKLMERPVGSGLWYSESDALVRDESAPIRAKQAEREALVAKQAEEAKQAERERIKAEVLAELEAETAPPKKAGKHGSDTVS